MRKLLVLALALALSGCSWEWEAKEAVYRTYPDAEIFQAPYRTYDYLVRLKSGEVRYVKMYLDDTHSYVAIFPPNK